MATIHPFDSYSLGATLYMPVLHSKVSAILHGQVPPPAESIVLCLEDALAERDVPHGLSFIDKLIEDLPADDLPVRTFLRPRDMGMARDLCARIKDSSIEGIVAPKVTPATLPQWLEITREGSLSLMVTLESADFFDPSAIVAIRDVLDKNPLDAFRVVAIRLGGNDLLSTLALRRERGVTSWESPLAWFLSMASSILIASGYPVAAPVYDIIDDPETLQREVHRDVAAGFISKTIIHPVQAAIIRQAFQVSSGDSACAEAAINIDAPAVFQFGGAMCEPATHRAWAERIAARKHIFGLR